MSFVGGIKQHRNVEFDPATHAQIRDKKLKEVILAERQYRQVRKIIRSKKLERVRLARKQLDSGEYEEFLRRSETLLSECREEGLDAEALFELQKECLEIETCATREYTGSQKDDDKASAKEQLCEELQSRISEKLEVVLKRAVKSKIKQLQAKKEGKNDSIPSTTSDNPDKSTPPPR